ncbi:unnamed protein product [Rotaria magnacalcarata]|uniref:Uncharacterized protein n=2 Tax=Rotaria magnacalcarata TaxID=392030 RepID=A0A815DY03_9BILA|nr:unnamed protein product [Rotaria magnacalcarata]CAF1651572.1 unnamed protein product [Rotaria magnacalcarata]CAF2076876.1 unnamed protein product [Rotaria magnacalcarata]CAF2112412.1 unnamed protein product [Rotaria magnacalcarata]CAF2119537.1 unnamed protein product [Rotaria magnacalcarata]
MKSVQMKNYVYIDLKNDESYFEKKSNKMAWQFRFFDVFTAIIILFTCTFIIQRSALYMKARSSTAELINSSASTSCSSLNVSSVRLITFDLFGALMLTEASMNSNIASLLPSLSLSDVQNFTKDWLNAYASFFGKSFSPALTHQPFQWVIRSSLIKILDSFKLSKVVPEGSITFNALVSAWGKLQPRNATQEVLTRLSRKYQLGVLSNGDKQTLQSALRVFSASINISFILSSDYPVNCFKSCSAMYAQALAAVDGDMTKVLHVAGSAYDTHGALIFGIFSGALDKSAMHTKPKPCFAFDNIVQLLAFFDV